MSVIIATILVLGLAVAFFLWVVRAMLAASCPGCAQEGKEEIIVPILPGYRWFCPACSGTFTHKEVQSGRLADPESDSEG